MKKLLALILAAIMALGVLPMTALAAEEYEYEEVSGIAYISISMDDRYVVSDGVDAGTIMAYVPVDLAELRNIKLEDYDLQEYYHDEDKNGKYDITVLHLYLYVLNKYK